MGWKESRRDILLFRPQNSNDNGLYEKVSKLSDEINLSRSQIFSQAVRYFRERKNNLELVRRINRAYSDVVTEDETELLEASKQKYAEIIEEEWQ